MKNTILTIITIIIGLSIIFLEVFIIQKIIFYYNIDTLNNLSFKQLFGIILIINIIKYKYVEVKSKKDYYDRVVDEIIALLTIISIFSFAWLIAYLISLFI